MHCILLSFAQTLTLDTVRFVSIIDTFYKEDLQVVCESVRKSEILYANTNLMIN